nr:ROK family protein [Acidithiobacillus sp.]
MTPAKTSVHPALAADPKIQRNAALHLGLDIGGTNLRLGVFRGLRLLSEYRTAPDLSEVCRHAGNREDAQRLVVRLVGDAIADALCKHKQVQHIGMGIPGFVDPGNSLLLQSPNLQHLENTDLISLLQKRFSLPVCLVNDANAAAYGEYLLARPHHSDLRHLLYVGLGTGIGGGLVLNGQVYPGAYGSALEIGHLIVEPNGRVCGCGNRGCLEQYASASGVKLSYTEYTGCYKTARDIGQMADAGDRSARQASWSRPWPSPRTFAENSGCRFGLYRRRAHRLLAMDGPSRSKRIGCGPDSYSEGTDKDNPLIQRRLRWHVGRGIYRIRNGRGAP